MISLGYSDVREGTRLTGISVVNGAQTTGAIGSVDVNKHDIRNLRVLCRIIRCQSPDKIGSIVRYNNTQNEITTWDQYSGDPEQARIEREFAELGYSYQRKRGFYPLADSVCIEDVAQPLAAFGGRYAEANRGRNRIFERSAVYKTAFDGKKARHILLVYTLSRAIDERRTELKAKRGAGALIALEEQQLTLLRNLRFKFFFLAVLARSLEPIVQRPIDVGTLAFSPEASKTCNNTFTSLVAGALPLVTSFMTLLCTQVRPDTLSDLMAKEDSIEVLASTISALMYSTNAHLRFTDWAGLLSSS